MPLDRILLSIHGVESDGSWQDQIDPSFHGIAGFLHRKYRFGRFPFYKTSSTEACEKEIVAFGKAWDEVYLATKIVPSVIAHSFGTYIVCRSLLRFSSISFDRLILCGSIVDRDFDWAFLIKQGRVRAVLNEKSGQDTIVAKFRSPTLCKLIEGSGPSGLDGFSQAVVVERDNPKFMHSDAFILRSHCDLFWRPFVFGNVEFAALCRRARQNDEFARRELLKSCGPIIRTHFIKFFGDGGDSPYASALFQVAFEKLIKYGAEGELPAKELIFAIVSGMWQTVD